MIASRTNESTPEQGATTTAPTSDAPPGKATRDWVARVFTLVEDLVYLGLGLLLAGSAFALLWYCFHTLVHSISTEVSPSIVITLLDQSLLVLLIVEVLYTVQVSFRAHALI